MGGFWNPSPGTPLRPGTAELGASSTSYGNPFGSAAPSSVPMGNPYHPTGGGFSGGGSQQPSFTGMGSYSQTAYPTSSGNQINYNPSQFDTSVKLNPQIQALQNQMESYRGGLAQGNDADAQLALGRQRDIASGMAKEGLQGALDRGFTGDSGYAQQRRLMGLDAGQSATAGLNASLTSDARKQQLQALQNEGGLAVQQAGVTQGQQNFNLSQWQAQNSAAQFAANFAAQQQQNQFQNQFNVANAQNQNQLNAARLYSGF